MAGKDEKPTFSAPPPPNFGSNYDLPSKKSAEEVVFERDLLADELKAAKAKLAALEKVTVATKAAKEAGKGWFAKVHIVGEGRREVKPDDLLTEAECEGLTEGVHYGKELAK